MNGASLQFPEITRERWEAELARLGAPVDALRTDTGEGITIHPLYEPGGGVARLLTAAHPGWRLHQRIDSLVPEAVADAVAQGADRLCWRPVGDTDWGGVEVLASACAAVDQRAKVQIEIDRVDSSARAPWRRDAVVKSTVVAVDLLGAWVRAGTTAWPIAPAIEDAVQFLAAAPSCGALLVDASLWHDAGATAEDELAFAIASALALWGRAQDARVPLATVVPATIVRVGLGGDVLVDLAKLRSLRVLLGGVVARLGGGWTPEIHARTAGRSRPAHDPTTNMIRATLEVFTGATGGADAIEVDPRRDAVDPGGPHAARWARNLSHVLRLESGLADVVDPWAGAAAIEALTQELGVAAWELARRWHDQGGVLALLERGELQARARASARRRVAEIAEGKRVVVGVNRHRPAGAPTHWSPPIDPAQANDSLVPVDLGGIVPVGGGR